MSKTPLKNIDPRRITGILPPRSIREAQAAVVLKYLEEKKDYGIFFSDLESFLRTNNELNRPETKQAVDLLVGLKLATIKVGEGGVTIYAEG